MKSDQTQSVLSTRMDVNHVVPRLGPAAALFLALSIGCGGRDDGRVAVYPVSGKVLVNGQPAAGATISFFPQSEDSQPVDLPVPSGLVDESGNYMLRSYVEGDGAPAGEYRVTVVWPAPPPPNATVFDTPDRLRGRYSDPGTSGLTATVGERSTEVPPFDLK